MDRVIILNVDDYEPGRYARTQLAAGQLKPLVQQVLLVAVERYQPEVALAQAR